MSVLVLALQRSSFVHFALLRRSIYSTIVAVTHAKTDSPLVNRKPSEPPIGVGCPLCRNGLDRFGYRDVLLLRQFLTPDGYIIGRRKTGICPKMQRKVAKAIRQSRKMGLLPNFKAAVKSEQEIPPK